MSSSYRMENHFYRIKLPPLNVTIFITHVRNLCNAPMKQVKKHLICQSSQLLMIITVFVYIKKVSHLPSQLGIFVFTFTVKRFHIYGTLLHLALKVFRFTGPYYIFTFRGATPLHPPTLGVKRLKFNFFRTWSYCI